MYLCENILYMKNYGILKFVSRLKLDEISAKARKHQLVDTKICNASSFSIKVTVDVDIAEDTTRKISTSVLLPNSSIVARYGQNEVPCLLQV